MLGFGPISSAPIGTAPASGPTGSGAATESGADTAAGTGSTVNIGLRTPVIYEPNSSADIVADATGVRAIVRDAIGGAELLDIADATIVSGVCTIDNDAVGSLGSNVDIELRWTTGGGQSRVVAGPLTVINLYLA